VTQEELDALMASDVAEIEEEVAVSEEKIVEEVENEEMLDVEEDNIPPVVTEDNKIVNQLDSVTKDSEEKATEIFDRLEGISEYISTVEEEANELMTLLKENVELFEKLSIKFDDVEIFKLYHDKNSNALDKVGDIIEKSQMSSDEIMMIMDTMQYQDIHRQKTERVINVMRGLLRYMNTLFGSDIKDEERVSSAQHIVGDQDTDDVVTNEDIEALLESFGKK
jgi:hypothetical protein